MPAEKSKHAAGKKKEKKEKKERNTNVDPRRIQSNISITIK